MMRSFDSAMPVATTIAIFTMWGIWVDDHIVYSPWAGEGWTMTPRVSMAVGMARWIT